MCSIYKRIKDRSVTSLAPSQVFHWGHGRWRHILALTLSPLTPFFPLPSFRGRFRDVTLPSMKCTETSHHIPSVYLSQGCHTKCHGLHGWDSEGVFSHGSGD